MKIALLSNVTVAVLAGMLRTRYDVWEAPGFGAWMETALAVPAALKAFGPEAVFLLLDRSHAPVSDAAVETARTLLEAALPQATVCVPDLVDLADEAGAFYDERMWKLGAMPWSLKGLQAIQGEVERLLRAMRGERKKVLAVDFDNTLWDGVIGEDGVAGIRPRAEFQRGLRALRERGVLLVGLSRNNMADVEPVWQDPRMVLAKDDFADLRIDWCDKCENLLASAAALNLDPSAFVFLDDNPAERAQMASRLPSVTVPDNPCALRRIERLHFPRVRVTAEDRMKTQQYHAEVQRRAAAVGHTLEDYLASLEIRTEIRPFVETDLARVAQLSQKSNQFNVCTNRYTPADLVQFLADRAHLILTLRAADRFGDQGLVAFVHAVVNGGRAEIVDWVMSCRAMNRRLEFTLEQALEDSLRMQGVTTLGATWRHTARNAPVRDFFERCGFAVVRESDKEKLYERTL